MNAFFYVNTEASMPMFIEGLPRIADVLKKSVRCIQMINGEVVMDDYIKRELFSTTSSLLKEAEVMEITSDEEMEETISSEELKSSYIEENGEEAWETSSFYPHYMKPTAWSLAHQRPSKSEEGKSPSLASDRPKRVFRAISPDSNLLRPTKAVLGRTANDGKEKRKRVIREIDKNSHLLRPTKVVSGVATKKRDSNEKSTRSHSSLSPHWETDVLPRFMSHTAASQAARIPPKRYRQPSVM